MRTKQTKQTSIKKRLTIPLAMFAIFALAETVSAGGTIGVNILTGGASQPDNADPTSQFVANTNRVKYFVKPNEIKNAQTATMQFTGEDNGSQLVFKQVGVENGMIVLTVQAKHDAKPKTVQVAITWN
jgi:hypothetical protein